MINTDMKRLVFSAWVITALIGLAASSGAAWSGKCVAVADGDTITVMHHGQPEKIRLFGVDCPERGQDFGSRAKQFTASLVFGKGVTVETVGRDRYGRSVAWVSVDTVNVNRELIRAGLAWWYRKHAARYRDLQELEREARKARVGLWSPGNAIPPWEFRRDHR